MEELSAPQTSAGSPSFSSSSGVLPKNLSDLSIPSNISARFHAGGRASPHVAAVCAHPTSCYELDIGIHMDDAALGQRIDRLVDGCSRRVKIKYPTG